MYHFADNVPSYVISTREDPKDYLGVSYRRVITGVQTKKDNGESVYKVLLQVSGLDCGPAQTGDDSSVAWVLGREMSYHGNGPSHYSARMDTIGNGFWVATITVCPNPDRNN